MRPTVADADFKDDNIAVNGLDKCLFMAIGPSMCKMQDYFICFWMITGLKGRHVIAWSVGEYSVFLGGKEKLTLHAMLRLDQCMNCLPF